MNKTTKHYFTNLFKRKKKILALYTFVCFMAYPFLEIASLLSRGEPNDLFGLTQTSFILALLTLGLLAALLPIFTFKFSHTKKHVDTYFAVPINRSHLFKSHFIAPILGVCIPILINYLVGGIILVVFTKEIMLYFELLMLLFLAFAIFASVYSINTFFVLSCNNVLDSSIITAAMAGVPLIFSSAVTWFVDSQIVNTGMVEVYELSDFIIKLFSPYAGFVLLADGLENWYDQLFVDFAAIDWKYIIYYIIVGIVFYFVSKQVFKKKKGENAEQLTKSMVTYPLLIHVGLFSLILLFNMAQMEIVPAILVIIAIFVAYVIATAIANRSMIINVKMVVKFILLIGIVNGFNYASRQTEFFGINRQVIDYVQYDRINFNYYSYNSKFDENEEDKEIIFIIDVKNMSEKEKTLMELLKEYQKTRSIVFKESSDIWMEDSIGSLNVGYDNIDPNNSNYRNAYFNLTEAEEKQFYEIVEEIKKEKLN